MSAKKRRAKLPPNVATEKRAMDPTLWPLWLLVLALPLVYSEPLQINFRLPKLLFAEVVGAVSLAALAWRLRTVGKIDLRAFSRRPVVLAAGALLASAAVGLLASSHRVFVLPAVGSLALALLCLVVWETAVRLDDLRRLIAAFALPGAVLAFVAVLQHHGFFQPFPLEVEAGSRLALTSYAGSPFDLATFLVLPILVAQGALARRDLGTWRWFWAILLVLFLYVVALTQTLSALMAITVGSAVLWSQLAHRRRLAAIGVLAVLVGGALFGLAPPLRERVIAKVAQLRGGDLNDALTGRLDGWRTGWWMFERHPIVGIGHGAYRAEFAEARLALVDQGVRFYRRQQQPFFENPHSDLLAALVGMGILGAAAVAAGLFWLAGAAVRAWRARRAEGIVGRVDAALMSAVLVASLLETTATFPLHLAIVAYPLLLVLAAVFRAGRVAGAALATGEAG